MYQILLFGVYSAVRFILINKKDLCCKKTAILKTTDGCSIICTNSASNNCISKPDANTWPTLRCFTMVVGCWHLVVETRDPAQCSVVPTLGTLLHWPLVTTGHHWRVLAMIYIRCQVTLRFNSAHFQNSQLYVKSINLEIHRRIWGGVPS